MKISVSDAATRLTELVGRAESGEEVILTLDGLSVAQLTPVVTRRATAEQRRAALERASAEGSRLATPGPDAAHSQDFLYDEFGLPA
jgi:antitoxin (DNA-binding transcriptional repressor) of toxin-antitoxin stability system